MPKQLDYHSPSDAYCSHGRHRAPKEGGIWIVAKGNKTRRWICAGCNEKRKEKNAI